MDDSPSCDANNESDKLMATLRSIFLVLALCLGPTLTSHAQAPAPLPPGMTQEQFDALVDAIGKSVTEKLKAEGISAAPVPPAPSKSGKASTPPIPEAKPTKVIGAAASDDFAVFLGRAKRVVMAIPALGERLGAMPNLLDESEAGGRGPVGFLFLLGLVAVVAVTAEAAVRRILRPFRERLAVGSAPERGLHSLINLGLLALLDGLGLLVVWLISRGAAGAWFAGSTGQDRLAIAVLTGIFGWRLYVLIFRIVLRPGLPAARLCAVSDDEAKTMYSGISAVMLLIVLWRILFHVLPALAAPADAIAAFQVFGGLISLALFIWLVVRSAQAARQWFDGLGVVSRWAGMVGRHWIALAVPFFVALGATQIYGAISGHANVSTAMLLTLNLVVGLLFFETLLQAFVRRLDSQLPGLTPAGDAPKLPDVVARCVRVAVLIGVAVVISETWVVDVLGLVSEGQWDQLTRSSRTAGVTLFLAFVLWELFKFVTEPYMDRKLASGPQPGGDGDASGKSASRVSTIMPLLRVTVAVIIGIVAVLIALEDFGVNTLPLLAGASVLGLAVSFGSQTLVRDIVSGIFYLTDDAFRVGEYIDCGRAKGTVEGFTLRSLKLRHQNGQVHTIPFGQLGQITNFSRDWITVKFNLRFARDTDVEKLRKAAKKIGTDMMEIPEFKAEILAPFKMQGIADIADNALLCRFKFTAKPGNPASIQREAVKRMFRTFPELGIEFAKEGAAVILHTTAASLDAASVEDPPRNATPAVPAPVAPSRLSQPTDDYVRQYW